MFTNIILKLKKKSCVYDNKQHTIRQLLNGECRSDFVKVKYVMMTGQLTLMIW